jgi:hypothetical protein
MKSGHSSEIEFLFLEERKDSVGRLEFFQKFAGLPPLVLCGLKQIFYPGR